jgi:hypothetical protein
VFCIGFSQRYAAIRLRYGCDTLVFSQRYGVIPFLLRLLKKEETFRNKRIAAYRCEKPRVSQPYRKRIAAYRCEKAIYTTPSKSARRPFPLQCGRGGSGTVSASRRITVKTQYRRHPQNVPPAYSACNGGAWVRPGNAVRAYSACNAGPWVRPGSAARAYSACNAAAGGR